MTTKWAARARQVIDYLTAQSPWTEIDWDSAEVLSESLCKRAARGGAPADEATALHRALGPLIVREGQRVRKEAQP